MRSALLLGLILLLSRAGPAQELAWERVGVKNLTSFGLPTVWVGDLDLDGDRKPDLVATAPRGSPYGRVFAYSNQGKLLYRITGTAQLALGSWQGIKVLDRAGDVDGADDFVVGAFDVTRWRGAGAVVSGKTGKVLVVGFDEKPGDKLGQAVAGCGDLDGDGVPDFASGGGVFGASVVRAFSGKTGKALWTWRGTGGLGTTVKSAGIDVDREGCRTWWPRPRARTFGA